VKLSPSEDEEQLLATADRVIGDVSPVGASAADFYRRIKDDRVWQKYAGLGWFDPELSRFDSFRHAQLFLQERAGRGLLRGPIAGTVVGGAVLDRAGRTEECAAVKDGLRRIGLAEPLAGGQPGSPLVAWDVDDVDWYAIVSPDGCRIVRADAVTLTRIPSIEEDRPIGTFTVTNDDAVVTEHGNGAWLHAILLAAAELNGVMFAVRDMSANYTRERRQFGVPVGQFQAVKHRCADMAVRYESAWSLCCLAGVYWSDAAPEAPSYVQAAKLLANEYAIKSCKDNVQNHGGIGFTTECNAHHFFKRAMVLSTSVGDRAASVQGLASHGFGLKTADAPSVSHTGIARKG
jgi:hypothetical protein